MSAIDSPYFRTSRCVSPPTVIAVSRNPQHGFRKQPQASIRLIAGEGVEGDAHRGVTVQHLHHLRRNPTAPNLCQVHLFASEMLEEVAAQGFVLQPGEIGENVLTLGLNLLSLFEGTQLRLGTQAVVEVTSLRTPCSKIDDCRAGLQDKLWGERDSTGRRTRRAGVMSVVRTGGEVHPGDPITVYLPPEPHRALKAV